MLSLGHWIKANRLRKKWAAEELARRAETSTGSVSRWERGVHNPSIDQFRRLCIEFDASADEALGLRRRRRGKRRSEPPTSVAAVG